MFGRFGGLEWKAPTTLTAVRAATTLPWHTQPPNHK